MLCGMLRGVFLCVALGFYRSYDASLHAFTPTISTNQQQRQRVVQQIKEFYATETEQDDDTASSSLRLITELQSKSVADLKKELTSLKVGFADVFEKEGLVRRLYEATTKTRQSPKNNSNGESSSSSSPTFSSSFVDVEDPPSKPAAAPSAIGSTDNNSGDSNNKNNDQNVIRTPLYFASSSDIQLAAAEGMTFSPTDQSFATIRIQVNNNSNKLDDAVFTLSLLLDTACSGIVLRSQVVEKYGLPKLQTPVTMTGAGGTAQNTFLTQISSFSLDDGNSSSISSDKNDKKKNTRFGPLPAAVQDIDVLPRQLDGIIGLTFLSQFAGIELDFTNGQVLLFRHQMPTSIEQNRRIVAQGDMTLVGSLGIYTVSTKFGGRGPVSLLVDSGAAHTLLNWKGVADLSLSRQSPAVASLGDLGMKMAGAMGSDNAVMQFTHRLHVSSQLNFDNDNNNNNNSQILPGLSLQGDERRRLPIDIGNIPILDALQSQGVGGILGIDVMMRCAAVQMSFRGPKRRITLIN